MRKTIYFRDDGSWEAIKGAAEKEGISVSKHIVRKCLGAGVVSKTLVKDSGQLDRIEGKLDKLLGNPPRLLDPGLMPSEYPNVKSQFGVKEDGIEAEKEMIIVTATKPDPYFKPMPKGGKK